MVKCAMCNDAFSSAVSKQRERLILINRYCIDANVTVIEPNVKASQPIKLLELAATNIFLLASRQEKLVASSCSLKLAQKAGWTNNAEGLDCRSTVAEESG